MHIPLYFSFEEGNLLCRLILSYIISDCTLRHIRSKCNKSTRRGTVFFLWIRPFFIPFFFVFIATINWVMALTIALLCGICDRIEVNLDKNKNDQKLIRFILEQILLYSALLILWGLNISKLHNIILLTGSLIHNYKVTLILLGYFTCIWPASNLIKHFLQKVMSNEASITDDGGKIEVGGFIGQFERVIIFTLVLLGQYAAIGFLITGKSIVRIASDDKHQRISSEYILVGTMLSYAIAILTGVFVHEILSLK
jgi:hypothetical protein